MKTILINPPARKTIRAEIPLKIDEEIGAFPSLGLLYVASYLKEKMPNENIEIIDAKIDNINFEVIRVMIEDKKPDIVGITTLTFSLLDVLETVRIIKEVNPKIKICLGGPHVSIFPKETLSFKEVDFVVIGEGEQVFFNLIDNLTKGHSGNFDINGLGYKDAQGNLFINGKKQFINNLDELAMPDRKLINYKKCYSLLGAGNFMASVQTTRGCPFRCIYCDQQSGKILRKRSVDNIISEIVQLHNLDVKDIFFVDDLFTLDKERVFNFCDKLLNEKLDISFKVSARVDTVDTNMLRRLKEAGCYRIHYGVESGVQRILDKLNKGITIQQIKNAFKLTKEAGIDTFAYFMLGSPGEGRQDILDTINFALNLKPDYAHFSICTPYPDTYLYKMAQEEGIAQEDYWGDFALHPSHNFKTRFWTKDLNEKELINLQNYANKRFYLRFPFLIKEISKLRSWSDVSRRIRVGWKIFKP